jgi:hypothetical protein
VRKYGTKLGGKIAGIALVIGIIIIAITWILDNQFQKKEIQSTVQSRGGIVQSITKVKLADSPFVDTMEGRNEGKLGNSFYKVIYRKNGKDLTAWYRSVDGLFFIHGKTLDINNKLINESIENKDYIKTYGERWIFN